MEKVQRIIKIYENNNNNLINIPKEIYEAMKLDKVDRVMIEYNPKTNKITITKIGE